jgi:IclR family pca regulon transcriptional regulator
MSSSEDPDHAPAQVSSQALERGLAILSVVAAQRGPLGIAELGRSTDLSKSTVHRYVATLVRLGYLEQDEPSRKYKLGQHALELGYAAIGSHDIAQAAAKPLQALADETGYTVNLAVLDGADIVYIDRRKPTNRSASRLELGTQVGTRLPAYCTSMGKVLLAYSDPGRVRAILDRTDLARRGPKTITAREALLSNLAEVARTGIGINDEELAPGLRSIAAPVRDRSGQVVAAMNLSIHLGAWNATIEAIQRRLAPPLVRCAEDLSKRIGYRAID